MGTSRSRRSAGALLAVLAATLLAPLVALATFFPSPRDPHGCHCPVKMACCEAGLCHAGDADGPSATPSWSGCRDEATRRDAVPPPSSALDGAILPAAVAGTEAPAGEAGLVPSGCSRPVTPAPPAPPPRRLPASR